MAALNSKTAVIFIDFINEIIHPDGKLSGKGYVEFAKAHGSLENLKQFLDKVRQSDAMVIHVRVAFRSDYIDHPESSPLFGAARKFSALAQNTWGTEFVEALKPINSEVTITKNRINAFFSTDLDTVLRANEIKDLLICGVATDLAVEATARDAHDRDYCVAVVNDCCIAANDEDHDKTIGTLSKLSEIQASTEIR